jgi:hypothetical protein
MELSYREAVAEIAGLLRTRGELREVVPLRKRAVKPPRDHDRSLAVVEAVLGQFDMAVLIGELLGNKVSQATTPDPPCPVRLEHPPDRQRPVRCHAGARPPGPLP